jgi:hypothetical protein
MSVKYSYSRKPHRTAKLLLALPALPCLVIAGTASVGIASASASPIGGWVVSLTANPTALFPGQSATLTAGASFPQGIPPTGSWYLHIVDVSESPSVQVAVCRIPSCPTSVSEPVATEQEYAAYVSDTPGQSTGILPAGTPSVIVDWRYFILSPFPPRF